MLFVHSGSKESSGEVCSFFSSISFSSLGCSPRISARSCFHGFFDFVAAFEVEGDSLVPQDLSVRLKRQ